MKYNEFTAKKLGEVLAFCRVGLETIDKCTTALDEALGVDIVGVMKQTNQDHAKSIESLARQAGIENITLEKAKKTGKKLAGMRDTYIGDEWDNPAELLEWQGFFEGAALVHWALVSGAADAFGDEVLKQLAESGTSSHKNLLDETIRSITQIGRNRSKD